jgi:hypothetical protein
VDKNSTVNTDESLICFYNVSGAKIRQYFGFSAIFFVGMRFIFDIAADFPWYIKNKQKTVFSFYCLLFVSFYYQNKQEKL